MPQRRPIIARKCPLPWTPAEDALFRRQLELLKADIREAGGLEAWLRDRLEAWLDEAPPCKIHVRPHV